jgi:hypothetical protein
VQPLQEARQRSFLPLGPDFDLVVLGISHPALYAEQPGPPEGRVAKTDALDLSFDKGVESFHRAALWAILPPCREFLAASMRSTAV